MKSKRYLIIGGVAVGGSAAARLRRLDEQAEIMMIDKGDYVGFSNCALPYRISGTVANDEDLILMNPQKFLMQYNIDVRIKSEAMEILETQKEVVVKDLTTGLTENIKYDKLILGLGAKAIVPNFPGLDKIQHFTLKTVNDIKRIMTHIEKTKPKHLTVVGGGFIGIEVAENLAKAHLGVTLIEGGQQLMNPLDIDMAQGLPEILEKNNVKVILNDLVDAFTDKQVLLKSGQKIDTDGVILAIGITPETTLLQSTAIKMDERGYIEVNNNYQTSNPDIYAGGDSILVTNALTQQSMPLALAGPANKQGRLIADHINGKKIKNNGYIGSSVIKIFDYTIASTGLNEKNIDREYEIVYGSWADSVSIMPTSQSVFIKMLFDKKDGSILGAQAISKGDAVRRIDVLATAIKAGMTVYDLIDLELCYAPTYGTGKDIVNKLGYVGVSILEQEYQQLPFSEIDQLVKNQKQVIDVREKEEYDRGHIDGVINIPMSEFRNRISEIDDEVYVHCYSGQRSYNVVMALNAIGKKAINIAGGYVFYKMFKGEK